MCSICFFFTCVVDILCVGNNMLVTIYNTYPSQEQRRGNHRGKNAIALLPRRLVNTPVARYPFVGIHCLASSLWHPDFGIYSFDSIVVGVKLLAYVFGYIINIYIHTINYVLYTILYIYIYNMYYLLHDIYIYIYIHTILYTMYYILYTMY